MGKHSHISAIFGLRCIYATTVNDAMYSYVSDKILARWLGGWLAVFGQQI